MTSNIGRAPRKARALLDRMMLNRNVTPEGVQWLVAVTDPFHDTEVSLSGYPDISATRSLCQTVTKTFTLESPSLAGANWDAHVFFLPLTFSFGSNVAGGLSTSPGYFHATMGNNGNYAQGAIGTIPSLLYGGVNCIGTAAGTQWDDASAINVNNVAFDATFSADMYRLIACGFEVVNTTSELNKGGAVTVYRIPSQRTTITIMDGTLLNEIPCDFVVAPPFTQEIASLYPDSKTWGASEGVYSISTLNTTPNEYFNPGPHSGGVIVPFNAGQLLAGTGASVTDIWIPPTGTANGGNDVQRSCSTALPWDVNGCVFTGLSTQTALTVTAKYFFERLPSPDNPQLLVLTRQPAAYDPIILEVYARCVAELPVGVQVGENPIGEWFARILGAIGAAAPMVGDFVGNAARGARQAIGAVMQELSAPASFQDHRGFSRSSDGVYSLAAPPPVQIVRPSQARRRKPLPPTPSRRSQKPKPPPLPRRYTQQYQDARANVLRSRQAQSRKPLPPLPSRRRR